MTNLFTLKAISAPLLAAAILFALPIHAQEEGGEVLTPNMTVNIKLNSALSDKETAFYSKIAQDIISRIPREVTLDEQLSKLKEINDNHEHVNIVSYLPPTDDVSTDKLIQHFKVKFIFSDQEGAASPEEAVIDARTVGLKTPEPPAEQPEAAPEPVPEADTEKAAPTQAEEAPAQAVAVKTEPAAPEKTATPTPARQDIPDLRLAFRADETQLSLAQRVELMELVRQIRQNETSPPKAYTFVVRSYNGPTGENTWLAEERLRAVTSLLRQQDINLASANVTEIFVHTTNNQFVEILPIN